VDITATGESREPDYESVAEFSAECFVPLTVGGGISTLEHITKLLHAGADKVSINSAAYENPTLLTDAANRFGAQCVVASLDARRRPDGRHECFRNSGTRATGKAPADWAREVEARGAGEILLTSIDRDGTMQGYDLELIQQVTTVVRIPVIASGGAGNYEHLAEAVQTGRASAVAAASIFHFTQQTPLEAKQHLAACGVPVRQGRLQP
jgi:cyclase